ncbi:hypothetical protein KSP24_07850 [Paenibacillus sp. AK121]|uniref:hypothetical protein n=1 Tax=Paenibacillus TaxID=44249 RepID=UPI001C2381AC|nr:hypothetical protein [Paenibacillus sp. AK121]MBU9706840.1 hypothetical protein [Paenibacillus sp. AK121]MEE4567126.1 hypothetical protein [Paenibacillus polymyxa]
MDNNLHQSLYGKFIKEHNGATMLLVYMFQVASRYEGKRFNPLVDVIDKNKPINSPELNLLESRISESFKLVVKHALVDLEIEKKQKEIEELQSM